MTIERFRLWQNPGWGSAIVEAQLAFYGLDHELVDVGDVFESEAARLALGQANPLAQVPVLQLPSGEVMTESAAMTLHLADLAGRDDLVPGPQAGERAAFLRWLIFIVANIYPAVSYYDRAQDFLPEPAAAEAFRRAVDARRKLLWRQFGEAVAARGGPWALGPRFSALDIFVAVMVNWRPGRAWFAAELPELLQIADAVAGRQGLAAVFTRNFP
jgi:GST-like protein